MEKLPFNISARTANLLGRENVVNHYSALIELVKNSFDADAKRCIIYADYLNDRIWLIDNGEGMNKDIIKNRWMIIGTDNKCEDPITSDGRIKAGAKGIGRFALDRLGRQCTMITKNCDGGNLFWKVNWEQFSMPNTVLTDVQAELGDVTTYDLLRREMDLGENFDEYILPCLQDKGTIFCIEQLRDDWEGSLAETQAQLETIRYPDSTKEFEIYALDSDSVVQIRDFKDHRLDVPSFEDYDYKLKASYSNGLFKITIDRNETDTKQLNTKFYNELKNNSFPYNKEGFSQKEYTVSMTLQSLLPNLDDGEVSYILQHLGELHVSLYYLKLREGVSSNIYKYRKFNPVERRNWLNNYGGIKIYRDDFKVRPYGEGNSKDWLDLSARRARNPAAPTRKGGGRISAEQLAGTVKISRLDSDALADVASREGLQSSPLFDFLKRIVVGLITLIERDRHYAAVALFRSHDSENKERRQRAEKRAKDVINKAKKDSKSLSKEDVSVLDQVFKEHEEERASMAGELSLLRGLAGIGAVTSSFAHDLRGLENKISNFMLLTKKKLAGLLQQYNIDPQKSKDTIQYLEIIEEKHVEINNWILFITGTIRKDKRQRKHVHLNDYFSNFLEMWTPLLSGKKINCNIDYGAYRDGKIRAFKIDLDSIFNNLFLNSVDILSKKRGAREIYIKVLEEPTQIVLKYADNGPGLSKNIVNPNDILEFGFTTKTKENNIEEGLGLGMYIVDCVTSDYSAQINVLRQDSGFGMEIVWPKVVRK